MKQMYNVLSLSVKGNITASFPFSPHGYVPLLCGPLSNEFWNKVIILR